MNPNNKMEFSPRNVPAATFVAQVHFVDQPIKSKPQWHTKQWLALKIIFTLHNLKRLDFQAAQGQPAGLRGQPGRCTTVS